MENSDIRLEAEANGKLDEVEKSTSPEVVSESHKPTPAPINYDTLVLAGGSTKGIIVIGALQYAHDNFLLRNIKTYVGTSSGSMISFMLAIGYTPIEIMVYICTNQLLEKMQNLNIVAMIQGRGACSFNNIQEQLEKMAIAKLGYLPTLNDLKIRMGKTLVCVTHNFTENRTEYLSWETHPHLPCVTAVRMSSNLPLIFEKYQYGNCLYVDGGISDNFSIDTGEKLGEKVLGITLKPDNGDFSNEPDIGIMEFIYKLIFIPIAQAVEYKISRVSDKVRVVRIEHNSKLKFFQFDIGSSTKLEMFSIGYEQMRQNFE